MIPAAELAEQIQVRAFFDVMREANARYWERRADSFDWAAPRPDDFTGEATPEEIAARAKQCIEIASMCRFHAKLLREAYQDAFTGQGWAA